MTDETEHTETTVTETPETEAAEQTTTTEADADADDDSLIESVVEVAKAPFEWLFGKGLGNDED